MRQLIILVFVLSLLLPSSRLSATQKDPPVLRERVVFPKPATTVITDGMRADTVVLKWHEGTRIRLRDGQFVFDPGMLTPADLKLLERFKLSEDAIKNDVSQVNKLFQEGAVREALPMFDRPEAELEKEKMEGEQNSGEELADLSLHSYLFPTQLDEKTIVALLDSLNVLSSIEIAYPQPEFVPLFSDLPPTTPSYTANQGYLDAAPGGIGARYAWSFPGGRGADVQIIDIEFSWNADHEDLPGYSRLIHNHGWYEGDAAARHGGSGHTQRGTQRLWRGRDCSRQSDRGGFAQGSAPAPGCARLDQPCGGSPASGRFDCDYNGPLRTAKPRLPGRSEGRDAV